MIGRPPRGTRVIRPPRRPPPRTGPRGRIERYYFRYPSEARRAALARLSQLGGNYRLVHQPSRRQYYLEEAVTRTIGVPLRVFFIYDAERDKIAQNGGEAETELEMALRRVDFAVRGAR